MHRSILVLTITLSILGLVIIILMELGFHNLFIKGWFSSIQLAWEDKGPTPLADKRFTPQGLCWANDKLIFANTWKNKNSRIYEYEPGDMKLLRYFDMPEGASHTSGLAWDGKYLWAVDYISHKAYCISLEESFSSSIVKVHGSFDLNLKGTSGCCIIPWNGQDCLAVSDFRNTSTTYIIQMYDALKKGSTEGLIVFSYKNEGFSQGLIYINGYLFESENKFGKSIINKIDLSLLLKTKDSRESTIVQYLGPSWGIEDLAWDGNYLWTSDEVKFRFYKTPLE